MDLTTLSVPRGNHDCDSSVSTPTPPSMSTPQISQDVLDVIVDTVAEQSFECLKKLSVTFRDASLELEETQYYPTIIGYIRQLQIYFDYAGTTNDEEETYQRSEKYNRALEGITSHVCGLKRLYVVFTKPVVGWDEEVASWGAISPTPCRRTLHHLRFNNPGLSSISFYNIHDILISFIFSNPRLDHVEFEKHSSIATENNIGDSEEGCTELEGT